MEKHTAIHIRVLSQAPMGASNICILAQVYWPWDPNSLKLTHWAVRFIHNPLSQKLYICRVVTFHFPGPWFIGKTGLSVTRQCWLKRWNSLFLCIFAMWEMAWNWNKKLRRSMSQSIQTECNKWVNMIYLSRESLLVLLVYKIHTWVNFFFDKSYLSTLIIPIS